MWLIIRVYSRIPQNSRKKYFCWLNIQKIFIIFFNLHTSTYWKLYRSSKIKMFGNEDFCQWQFTPPGKLLESRFPLSLASDFWHFYNNFMGSCFFVVRWLKKESFFQWVHTILWPLQSTKSVHGFTLKKRKIKERKKWTQKWQFIFLVSFLWDKCTVCLEG